MTGTMKLCEKADGLFLEEWASRFQPAGVILRDLASGRELRETALVAAEVRRTEGRAFPAEVRRYLAAGNAARSCAVRPDAVAFSPLRRGQAAHYHAAVYLFRCFLKQLSPGVRVIKPVLYIHAQEQTTEVEKQALLEAGIQAGARKVFFVSGALFRTFELCCQKQAGPGVPH